jgi:hypothetical protein
VAMKVLEWFYYEQTCILMAYWEISPVLPLSSYVLSPMMLPLLETMLELLLWNSFQWHHHIFLDVFRIIKSSSL